MSRRRSNRFGKSVIQSAIESLELRTMMAGTPYTSDGQPWPIASSGISWVEAENFDLGGEGQGYHDTTTANQGGKYRLSEGVDIEGPAANTDGTYNTGYASAGEWMAYTLNVAQSGSYVFRIRASNANPAAATAHATFGGGISSGAISIPNTGGWGTFKNFEATVNLSAGQQVMTVYVDSGGYNLDYLSLQSSDSLANPQQAYGVRGLPPLVSAGGQARVEAENYDTGGQNIAYYRSSTTKSSTATYNGQPFRPADLVSTGNGGTGVITSYWKPNDWTEYTVNAITGGQYELLASYARGDSGSSNFSISTNDVVQVTGVAMPSTGGWYTYNSVGTVITLNPGPNVIRFTTGAGQINLDYLQLIESTTFGNNGSSWQLPASGNTRIEAENFNLGTSGYSDATSTNTGSSNYRPGTTVDLSPTTDASGAVDVIDFNANEFLNYTIRPDLTGNYDVRLRVKSATAGQIKLSFDAGAGFDAATNPELLSYTANIPANADWQTISIPVRFIKGLQTMRIQALTNGLSFNWIELQKDTTTDVKSPGGSGSYAAEPPDAALNSSDDLFDRVYTKQYDWINRPVGAAIPTNDWWTQILEAKFAASMWAYPQQIQNAAGGVTVTSVNSLNITAGNIGTGTKSNLTIGGVGTTFTRDALLDYGDWTVKYRMEAAAGSVDVTMGRGLPYTWFEFNSITPTVSVGGTFTAYDANGAAVTGNITGDRFRVDNGSKQFAIYAPAGTTFTRSGSRYTVTFSGGEKYLVVAVLPDSAAFNLFYDHAYAIPRQGADGTPSSKYDWTYDASAGVVNTIWNLRTEALKAGASLDSIQGWLPQNYEYVKSAPTMEANYTYPTIQGAVKIAVGKSFTVGQQSTGLNFALAMPKSIGGTSDYSASQMLTYIQKFIQSHTNAAASTAAGKTILTYGGDTYWGAKNPQEYAEYALMAKSIGATAEYNIFLDNLRTILTDWLTYTPGEANHYFAWYPGTQALVGFDPSYGSENFTDHMFHYGYFTSAAGVLATLDPTWASQYGTMAKMIAMQYANWQRADGTSDMNSLPFMRTFEPWIGHSYAGGTGDARGNNEESTSESIQSWLGVALLGQALNDPAMTAAGMMGYTVQSKATQYQWFDVHEQMFQSTTGTTAYARSNVAINYDDSKGYGTFFGANPEYILGIESLPLWPSLDFLGQYSDVARKATQQMLAQKAIYDNDPTHNTWASFETGNGVNDWLNINLGFQSMYDPQATADEYARMISQATPTGVSGNTGLYYYQTHAYRTYGLRDWNYHLSLPIGGVYTHAADSSTMSNTRTYMVYNPSTTAQTVNVYDANGNVIDSFTAAPQQTTTITRAPNAAPTISNTSANPTPVTATTTTLSVTANDDAGEANLKYVWSAINNPPAAVSFSSNNSNSAKSTLATFTKAGTYTFQVTATDLGGLSATNSVTVVVNQSLQTIAITPTSVAMNTGATQQFSASASDQFNQPMSTAFAWSATGGTISTSGLFTAGNTGGSFSATVSSGSLSASSSITITQPSLFTGSADIGTTTLAGSNSVVNGTYTLKSAGADIWGTSDSFRYVYVPFTGDGQIVARVTGVTNTNTWAKAGVMFRSSLAANAQETLAAITPGQGATFIRRTTVGGSSSSTTTGGLVAPYWVKLVRSGNSFSAFRSPDGVTWTQIGTNATIAMPSSIYVGLALSSHNTKNLATATYTNVAITQASNLSLNKTVTVSSGTGAQNLVDGTASTRWTSAAAGAQWATIDLGAIKSINRAQLGWSTNYARNFQLQYSTNNSTWTNFYTTTAGNGGALDLTGLNLQARYIRLNITSGTFSSYYATELAVFGT